MKKTIPPYRVPGVSRYARPVLACVAALLAALVSAATAAEPATAPAGPGGPAYPPDLPARALAALDVKCAACHGPQLTKPKKFGYVTDLPRMAANPKLVIPFQPDRSSLWTSIEEGEMPPEDAKTGQLTADEKEAIRQWIVVGAPPLPPGTGSTTHPAAAADAAEPTLSLPKRIVRLTGRLHPLVVHFPIAMLMAAAMAEIIWLVTRQEWLAPAIRFCVLVGCVGAVVGAALGWINSLTHSSSQTLTNHAILGTVAAVWAIPIVYLSERVVRRAGPNAGRRERVRLPFQIVLFAGVILFGIAAHIGGALVYGEDYFRL